MKLRETYLMQLNSAVLNLKDDNLIIMALQGDQEALHVLFARYRRLLYDLAHRVLRNDEEAEDAVQNCLLLAYRNLSDVKCQSSFRSWLVKVLIDEAFAIVRKKKSRPTVAPAPPATERDWLEGFRAAGPHRGQALAKSESVGALMARLVRLPAPLRSTVMLCDIGEHTIREASALLGLAPKTAKARLHRGRGKLGPDMRRRRPRIIVPDVLIGV